jgi:sec-independent protein translocase protein TatA
MLSSVLLFLNIGSGEMVLIVFAALMLFGGNKLPEIARGLGKGIRDFKDASEDVKREINNQINNYEEKKTEKAAEIEAAATPEPETEPIKEGVAGTIPAFQGYAIGTDAVEEHETAESPKATAEDATYEHQPEGLRHPVTEPVEPVSHVIDLEKTHIEEYNNNKNI